jgi:hypothetical protein
VTTNADFTWKGRFIVTQDGHVDLPPDRHDIHGRNDDAPARMRFVDTLNEVMPSPMLFKIIQSKLLAREIDTRAAAEVTLLDATHEGERWVIAGDSRASAGYFYVEARCLGPITD